MSGLMRKEPALQQGLWPMPNMFYAGQGSVMLGLPVLLETRVRRRFMSKLAGPMSGLKRLIWIRQQGLSR